MIPLRLTRSEAGYGYLILNVIGAVLAQTISAYDYNGGVSLFWPNSSCPAGTVGGGDIGLLEACCGAGQVFSAGSTYCCPSGMLFNSP